MTTGFRQKMAWLVIGPLLLLSSHYGWALAASTKTVVDSAGRRVTFKYPLERIIVTDDTIADPVRLFGKQKLVVGIENSIPYRGYFPEMAQRPLIGNQWRSLNWELIVALKPDAILMPDHPAVTPRIISQAERLNIPVLVVRWHYPDSMPQAVQLLGEVFGEPKRAERFIQWRQNIIDQITERLQDLPIGKRRKAYAEVDISGPIGRAAGQGMPVDETLRLAGLKNICEFRWSKEISSEWLLARNPDVIIMNDYGGAGEITGYHIKDQDRLGTYLAQAKQRKKFKRTAAAKNNKFYVMNSKMRGSMHMIGALYLAKSAYPELFSDLEPLRLHRDFFQLWMQLPYQGIWFFPMPGNN